MRLVIFGLTISSSWGSGHATLWRGMCKALRRLGAEMVFFEHGVPYYAQHRDAATPEGATLVLTATGATFARPRGAPRAHSKCRHCCSASGSRAIGVQAGQTYLDVGTLDGYRAAMHLLASHRPECADANPARAHDSFPTEVLR